MPNNVSKKYLKARLIEAGVTFRKTHDLLNLLKLLLAIEPVLGSYEIELTELSIYSISGRYPGFVSNENQSKKAVESCARIRRTIRERLNLSDAKPKRRSF